MAGLDPAIHCASLSACRGAGGMDPGIKCRGDGWGLEDASGRC